LLGFAILGPGRFAEGRIVPALLRAGNCRLVAVVSRDRDRAEAFAEEHGVAKAYDDLGAALADPEVEAVWVATPHALHREHVEQAAAARRHVLCEKPLATTVEDARAIVRACRQAGVTLGTGYHLRHHPLHKEMRRLVLEGELGEVALAQAEWSLPPAPAGSLGPAPWRRDPALSGGGIVTGTGVHAIDLLRFVLNDEVDEIMAFTDARTSPIAPLESRALAQMRFRAGTLATVRCARGVHAPGNDLYVQGVTGSATAHRTIDEATRGTLSVSGTDALLSGIPAGSDMYAFQAHAFAEAVERGEEPDASGEDGLRMVELTAALYESARSGRSVAC
jgi:1,5-anhydro-D-fructose reductase (1,5-anhydro-D-mannitol-forming)